MKDEIKEILECFSSPYINFSEMLFNRDERLLDYITNLQEENKELGRYYTRANNEFLELNKRINKAIEYIKGWQSFPHTNGSTHNELRNLLNILEGSDDND